MGLEEKEVGEKEERNTGRKDWKTKEREERGEQERKRILEEEQTLKAFSKKTISIPLIFVPNGGFIIIVSNSGFRHINCSTFPIT